MSSFTDFYQQRTQEVRDSFLEAVSSGDKTVEEVASFCEHLQEMNEGRVTPTLAGIQEAVNLLQP